MERRQIPSRGREGKLVALLDISDTQLQHANGRYEYDMEYLKQKAPRDVEIFKDENHPEFGRAYENLMGLFDKALEAGELEYKVIDGVPEALEHLSRGFELGVFTLATPFSLPFVLKKTGIDRYYQNPDLLVSVSKFGSKASKAKPETWIELDDMMKNKGYELGIFVDDNVKAVKAAVKSGVLKPEQVYHVKRGYEGSPRVEEDGVQFMRISSLAEISKYVRYAEASRPRMREQIGGEE
jgi:phosphoglycolate phosphatase-like HAD superfamily hydrolase